MNIRTIELMMFTKITFQLNAAVMKLISYPFLFTKLTDLLNDLLKLKAVELKRYFLPLGDLVVLQVTEYVSLPLRSFFINS